MKISRDSKSGIEYLPRLCGALPFILNTVMRKWEAESVHFYSAFVLGSLLEFPFTSSHILFRESITQVVMFASHNMVYFNHVLARIRESKGGETSATARLGTLLCKSGRCTRVAVSKRTECRKRCSQSTKSTAQRGTARGGTAPCDARLQETLTARPAS